MSFSYYQYSNDKSCSICGNYLGYLHGKIMVSRSQLLLCDDVYWVICIFPPLIFKSFPIPKKIKNKKISHL